MYNKFERNAMDCLFVCGWVGCIISLRELICIVCRWVVGWGFVITFFGGKKDMYMFFYITLSLPSPTPQPTHPFIFLHLDTFTYVHTHTHTQKEKEQKRVSVKEPNIFLSSLLIKTIRDIHPFLLSLRSIISCPSS